MRVSTKSRLFTAIGTALAVLAMALANAPAAEAASDLTLVYQIDGPGRTIHLPLQGTVSVTVDWGDGSTQTMTTPGYWGHTYSAAGEVTIAISGTLTHLGVGDQWLDSNSFLRKITSWGDVGLTSLSGVLRGAWYATELPSTLPSTVTDLSFAFSYTQQFNQDLSSWDISNVTTLRQAFLEAQAFNGDISGWNTSSVTDMSYAFYNAYSFNTDISGWDTSSVTDMSRMFEYAGSFNQPIGSWNTAKVTTMAGMFFVNGSFNQDLSGWDTSAVTDMSSMFFEAGSFNSDVSTWDTSSVTNFRGMFQRSWNFNQDISAWDTSAATDMSAMFDNAQQFNQDISGWNTALVENMDSMFRDARSFNQPIGAWDTSSLKYLDYGFAGASSFNQDISAWDVSGLTSLRWTFGWMRDFNSPLEGWDVSNVTSFEGTFHQAESFNQPLQAWDTSSATYMVHMFNNAHSFNQPLVQDAAIGGWNTSKVQTMACMFHNAWAFDQPVDTWDTSSVTEMNCMFSYTRAFNQPITETEGGWTTANVTNMDAMFEQADAFDSDISSWNTSKVTNMNRMFFDTDVFNQDITGWDVSNVVHMELMFSYSHLFDSPLEGWNLASLVNANGMFHNAKAFNQPLAAWDTSNIRWMNDMFSYNNIFNQPLNDWDVSNVETMYQMFGEANAFDQPLDKWNTSKVTNMSAMFSGADLFNQDISAWDVSNVTSMGSMFASAQLFNQPLDSWDTGSVRYMGEMFNNARMFNQPLNSWDVSQVEQMQGMFNNARSFNQDLSQWDTGNVRYMNWMFANNPVFNQPIDDWNTSNVNDMPGMFYRAEAFNQPIYKWDVSKVYNFEHMFHDAYAFDQDLSSWNTANSYTFYQTFVYSGMSTSHYSAFLDSLANGTPDRRNSIRLDATERYTCDAAAARTKLIDEKFWWIGDEGMADCKSTQTIDFADPADFPVNKVKFLSATASSGLPVSFKWISGPCAVDGNRVEATGLGVCVVAAQQEGDAEFYDAVQVVRWINVLDPADPDVIYDANGADSGAAPVDPSSPYTAGSTVTTLSGDGLVKAHFDFTGWNTKADGSGTHYDAGAQLTLGDRDLYLYAEWTAKPLYSLTYDANGADSGSAPIDEGGYESGQSATVAGAGELARDHFSFVEWNTAADGSGDSYSENDSLTFGDADVVLYAIWQEDAKYRLSYDANGADSGSAPSAEEPAYAGTELSVAGTGTLSKENHYFVAWNTAADGSGQAYEVGDTVTIGEADVTLYAIWAEQDKHSVVYLPNGSHGGSAPVDSSTYFEGDPVTILSGHLNRDGFEFTGWNTAADGSGTHYDGGDVVLMPASGLALYAEWAAIEAIEFALWADGSDAEAISVRRLQLGTIITLPSAAEVSRPGYLLEGWNTAADGTGPTYAPGAAYTVKKTETALYALWRAVQVKPKYVKSGVRFRLNSAKLTMGAKRVLREFAQAQLKGRSEGLVIKVTGFIQPGESLHTAKQMSRWRAVVVVRFLKALGVKAQFKVVAAGVASSVKSPSRKTVVLALWEPQR